MLKRNLQPSYVRTVQRTVAFYQHLPQAAGHNVYTVQKPGETRNDSFVMLVAHTHLLLNSRIRSTISTFTYMKTDKMYLLFFDFSFIFASSFYHVTIPSKRSAQLRITGVLKIATIHSFLQRFTV